MGKTLGILSLVFGLVGLIFSPFPLITSLPFFMFIGSFLWWFVTLMSAVPGIIWGSMGIKKDDGAGLAIAGLIISCVALVLWVIFVILANLRPGPMF